MTLNNQPMNNQIQTTIAIPLNFRIACATYHLSIPEVLQLFIDHISFYDSLSQKSDDIYRSATNTLLNYSISIRRETSTAFLNHRDPILKYIRKIIKIATLPVSTPQKKRKLCVPIVRSIYQILDQSIPQHSTVMLEGGNLLQLKMDLCVICEIHNCSAEEYLEHFMSQISLPKNHAQAGLKKVVENQAMGFFFKSLSLIKDAQVSDAHRNLQIEFIDRIQEAHLWLFIIRDLKRRERKYEQIYLKYYHQILATA